MVVEKQRNNYEKYQQSGHKKEYATYNRAFIKLRACFRESVVHKEKRKAWVGQQKSSKGEHSIGRRESSKKRSKSAPVKRSKTETHNQKRSQGETVDALIITYSTSSVQVSRVELNVKEGKKENSHKHGQEHDGEISPRTSYFEKWKSGSDYDHNWEWDEFNCGYCVLHSMLIAGCSLWVGLVEEDDVRDRNDYKSEKEEERRNSSC